MKNNNEIVNEVEHIDSDIRKRSWNARKNPIYASEEETSIDINDSISTLSDDAFEDYQGQFNQMVIVRNQWVNLH